MKKIAHVTILNPVDHTRIIKLVRTQIELGYTVKVVGKHPHQPFYHHSNYQFYSTGSIKRNFFERFQTHLKILFWWIKNVSQIDLFWIHTPELFWLFILNFLFRKNQVYDVHENYFENIYYADYYPKWIRQPLSYVVRFIEILIAKIAIVVYAEYGYENILYAKVYEIIPNAFDTDFLPNIQKKTHFQPLKLIISGNLSESWGIMNAIQFWEVQNQYQPTYLTIIGYAPLKEFAQKIRLRIQNSSYKSLCRLIGIEYYVPYSEIIQAISESDIVLAPYQIHPQFLHKIPTKFFEAIAMKKTLLFSNIPYWKELNAKYSFGFCIEHWDTYWKIQFVSSFEKIPEEFYHWKFQIPKIQKIMKLME
ncbi:MAG: hypothetical protein QXU40_04375 [Candidatus Pacearchaeota archaeon]